MRDDETGTTGGTGGGGSAGSAGTTGTPPGCPPPHLVDERDVRLALDRLGLHDRALTVHRATAFLTALGVTVTHAGHPVWSLDDVTPRPDDADGGLVDGDVANLLEVRSHLRDRAPVPPVGGPRVASGHRPSVVVPA